MFLSNFHRVWTAFGIIPLIWFLKEIHCRFIDAIDIFQEKTIHMFILTFSALFVHNIYYIFFCFPYNWVAWADEHIQFISRAYYILNIEYCIKTWIAHNYFLFFASKNVQIGEKVTRHILKGNQAVLHTILCQNIQQ